MTTWRDCADALVAELVEQGKLTTPTWRAAMRAVPRHEFAPSFYEKRDGTWREVNMDTEPRRWLQRVCSNAALVTQIRALPGHLATGPTSSSSAPGLMARMLEALDLHDGHTVCEIGTGTGYNAALLSYRLGHEYVFSVDIDAGLVDSARERLRGLGYKPHLAVADGAAGWPGKTQTFDRIIATCAVDRIPRAWIEQTRQDGMILTELKIGTRAGNLVALRRSGDAAEGRFLGGFADFMSLRGDIVASVPHPERDRRQAQRRTTTVMEQRPWESPVRWFLACAAVPSGVRFGYTINEATRTPEALFLSCPDGSWTEVAVDATRGRTVWEHGPSSLWSAVEQAHDVCAAHSHPDWSRLGLTVSPNGQHRVWVDNPNGPHWTLTP